MEVDFEVEIQKQAPKAMTDAFRECMSSNNANIQICESRAKEAWGNVRGKNPTAQELREGLQEGMVEAVGEQWSECMKNQTSSVGSKRKMSPFVTNIGDLQRHPC